MKFQQKAYIIALFLTFIIASFFVDLSQVFGLKKILIRSISLILIGTPLLIYIKMFPEFKFKNMFKIKAPWIKSTLIISMSIIAIAFLIRYITIGDNDIFFSWAKSNHYGKNGLYIYLFFYTIHSFLQEVIARGMIIDGFRFNFSKKNINIIIIITSISFGIAHFYLGLFTVIITSLTGFILGRVYVSQKNIWGVSVIHYLAGLVAISFGWA